MVDRYLALEPDEAHAVFHVRLGLCVIDLFNDEHGLRQITPVIERRTLQAADAYAAREVLSHQRPLPLTTEGSRALVDIVRVSGLGQGTMPEELLGDLIASTRTSEKSLMDALSRTRPQATEQSGES